MRFPGKRGRVSSVRSRRAQAAGSRGSGDSSRSRSSGLELVDVVDSARCPRDGSGSCVGTELVALDCPRDDEGSRLVFFDESTSTDAARNMGLLMILAVVFSRRSASPSSLRSSSGKALNDCRDNRSEHPFVPTAHVGEKVPNEVHLIARHGLQRRSARLRGVDGCRKRGGGGSNRVGHHLQRRGRMGVPRRAI